MQKKDNKKDKRPRVLQESGYQLGRTNESIDKMIEALKPGKRLSESGNTYWERRKNRSDKDPKKRL